MNKNKKQTNKKTRFQITEKINKVNKEEICNEIK